MLLLLRGLCLMHTGVNTETEAFYMKAAHFYDCVHAGPCVHLHVLALACSGAHRLLLLFQFDCLRPCSYLL